MSGETEETTTGRVLDFRQYTDDTAPDYDGLTVAYTLATSAILIAATVAVVWLLEDRVVGELADASFGQGGVFRLLLLAVVVPGVLGIILTVGRYLSIRAIDSESLPLALGITIVQVPVYGVLLTVALELYVGLVSEGFLLSFTAGAILLVSVGTLLVLATDWDFSAAAAIGLVAVGLFVAVAIIAQLAWSESTNGLLWTLYLWLWSLNLYVFLPAYFLGMYVHDVWRISEAGLSPTLGALSTYTAATTLVLLPIEYLVGLVVAFVKADSESSSTA